MKKFLKKQIENRSNEYTKILRTEQGLPIDVLIAMAENTTADLETTFQLSL